MEEEIRSCFNLEEKKLSTYSPLALAFMGDCIFELVIRTVLLLKGNSPANKLHKASIKYVSAPAQAAILDKIYDSLSEDERQVYTRGRNSKPRNTAKNASLADYHKATGLETLLGYLYLNNRMDRVLELVKMGIE